MKINEILTEKWSQKYKSSINCSHPKGFSQRAHCAGKKKHNESIETEMVCEDCGMCQTHGSLNEIKKGQKDSNGYTRCWPGKHAVGTKKGKNGGQVRNCQPNEDINENDEGDMFGQSDRAAQNMRLVTYKQRIPAMVKLVYSGLQNNAGWFPKQITGDLSSITAMFKNNPYIYDLAEDLITQDVMPMLSDILLGIDPRVIADISTDNLAMQLDDAVAGIRSESELWNYISSLQDDISIDEGIVYDSAMAIEHNLSDLLAKLIYEAYTKAETRLSKSVEEQFDLIEAMVEAWAQHHGVDAEQIWEEFESVDDHELLEESAAWHRKAGKNKNGGLNAKGVASYRREHPGSKLQTAVTTKPSKLKPGSKAAKRRKSFCARMSGVDGPMKKPNGEPTRKALSLKKWNC
ncbi:hypothetical protein UFOVP1636_37 [uncultured Caudovirales phage]|uniref:DUF6321 domain-containing protein n=1 Tax=uncultured Caudovirales phage TaxID=2100421 RepID=A0A6J5T0I2_9CAUD|nr:hypothetical protein UFOVP1636_37 [uncultured Caudovirales phage]